MDEHHAPGQPDLAQGHLDLGKPEAERSLLADLVEGSRLHHTSKDHLEPLNFVARLRSFAPFNAILLQVQKPGLTYAASAWDWRTRFNRTIKGGARPLVILWPFSPVALVFDVQDTEGDELAADIAQTFHATGSVTEADIERLMGRLASRGVYAERIAYGDAMAGKIQVKGRSTAMTDKPNYQVRIKATHEPNVQFVSLAHELGHLFLGHLRPDKYLSIDRRSGLDLVQQELEAESLADLVCKRRDVTSKSESYLVGYSNANTTIGNIDFYQLTKAAGLVETALGIAAHTLFESKAERRQG